MNRHFHAGHSHDHGGGTLATGARKGLLWAFLLNIGFVGVEVVLGLFTGSFAVITDALHDTGDALALGLAWYLHRLSMREPKGRYTYGYRRLSLLGAGLNSLILVIGSLVLIVASIIKIFHPGVVQGLGMAILAVGGIFINGLAVRLLQRGSSLNEKMARLHLMQDVLGWVAVLIAGIAIHYTGFTIIDPILSLALAIWILVPALKGLRTSGEVLLEAAPRELDLIGFKESLLAIHGMGNVHDVHAWSMDGSFTIATIHACPAEVLSVDEVLQLKTKVREVADRYGLNHTTVEIEFPGEQCHMDH